MSIGKRIIDLAKSELNSLLERAARIDDDDDPPRDPDGFGEPPGGEPSPRRAAPRGRAVRVEDLSDAELEAEIERRRLDREIEERSRRASAQSQAQRAYGGQSASNPGAGPRPSARAPGGAGDPIARAYAALEVAPGSDFETVRKAYRNMMRKYHPDRHASTPEKQKAANELAQKLTESYRLLEKRLRVR